MPNHIRQQVREAFAAQVTGLATSGARVFQSRIRNMEAADLPGLRIYTEQEAIDDNPGTTYQTAPDLQHRTITLRCEALAQANNNLDDTLDAMCKEVEIAIAANPDLGGLAKVQCALLSTSVAMEDDMASPSGIATMVWKIVVLTMSDKPDVAL